MGSFTGHSALIMALALPQDGWLVGMEIDENNAKIAKKYWEKAGVSDRMELRVAPAVETMQSLLNDGQGSSFDLLFIGADKPNYLTYWDLGLKLARPGGMLIRKFNREEQYINAAG